MASSVPRENDGSNKPSGGSQQQRGIAAQFKQGESGEPTTASERGATADNWLQLDGKVVVITGGASGLGSECGEELAALGAKCVFADL